MTAIPTPETLTPQWFTDCLRAAGHRDVRVRDFRATRIGTGQIGLCLRFELDLEDADPGVPRTLVGKFPSDDPTSRATGVQLRNYLKEVSFYQSLQRRLDVSTPRCYFARIDGEGPAFALLLEDLAPAAQGDQLSGCSADVARAAVLELVGLHGPSWNDPAFRGVDWIGEPDAAGREQLRALYAGLLPGFLDRYGDRLEPDERAILAAVADAPGAPLYAPLGRPFALVHVDYRLDNLLIDRRRSPPAIAVVDWQSITLGNPLADVAYFLGAGMLPEARRPVEASIVRAYHTRLVERGIADYPWAECWEDYRRGSFAGFGVTVIASMLVQQTVRGDEMFTVMARRHSRHALDLGADEFLS
ncbi:MAG: aminoglycoside phosphotransferase family protein [Pseudomonadales bacterium]|nr:aminoglycoside phosphotransferase family protein [Pseudomonadales bacterium]